MRIVSLCPSMTETLAALGLLPSLAGVTRFCIHPAAGVEAIPKVGGTKDPDLDRIVALQPDLVLLNAEENRREDYEALDETAHLLSSRANARRLEEALNRDPAEWVTVDLGELRELIARKL